MLNAAPVVAYVVLGFVVGLCLGWVACRAVRAWGDAHFANRDEA
jgi:hypothetical protein